jgi:hypothetical protein
VGPRQFGVVVDSDGHIFEDEKGILRLMPAPYHQEGSNVFTRNLFPPLDHLHSANLVSFPPGSFRAVGPDGWLEFLQDVGIETTVLYPTRGLAYGKVVNRDFAVDLARAYNGFSTIRRSSLTASSGSCMGINPIPRKRGLFSRYV